MLGHNHPAVLEAVAEQLARGVHFGASHELELEWAELVRELIPSAERVRFTVTGTEATMLAFRVARAYTGKSKIVRFGGHFHGWHDQAAFGGAGGPAGIPESTATSVLIAPPGDIAQFRALAASREDIAAVILEPTGATFGHAPLPAGFLQELREITASLGIVLIFDEVITGFRCSPGGAQAHFGITPDLTTLAKIIAGGFPGAALVGRAAIMSGFEYTQSGARQPAVPHQGTYNAGPVSAAAGIATLRLIRSTDLIERANRAAAAIRDGMNSILRRAGSGWCAYGDFSGFHLFTNPAREPVTPERIQSGEVPWTQLKGGTPLPLAHKIRAGFLLGGVDIIGWPGGVVSGVHGPAEVDRTLTAFENLLPMLAEEGDLR
jgi:glutamate-1-semialdehyde 2,1-aminomutase